MNPVRELESGARPRDWVDGAFSGNDGSGIFDDGPAPAEHALATLARVNAVTTSAHPATASAARQGTTASSTEHAPARAEPQRYKVQFEASEEYVELVERAKALLSHKTPRADLSELHLRAMRTLESEHESQAKLEHESEVRHESEPKPESGYDFQPAHEPQPERESSPQHPRQRGRHVPAAIRRAVFERDAGRCTYASDSGERCRETALLELHHTLAFARGGVHRLDNVTLRCRAHNTLAAELDFGRDFVALARDSSQHEPWSVHRTGPDAPPRTGFR
jgi:5-methylcytosine-specific restriction endonuclease McrA